MRVDLNCDMGESYGAYVIGNDAAVLPHVTSINIACGFHGGDPGVMRRTVHAAVAHGVAIGAHPGLPDLVGFGRRDMAVSAQDAYDMTVYQIGAVQAVATAAGTTLQHVKPHGARYNMAAVSPPLADAIARAVRDVNPRLILLGLSGSALLAAGPSHGIRTASEVFADRNYQADGTLVPRSRYVPGGQTSSSHVTILSRLPVGKSFFQSGFSSSVSFNFAKSMLALSAFSMSAV